MIIFEYYLYELGRKVYLPPFFKITHGIAFLRLVGLLFLE